MQINHYTDTLCVYSRQQFTVTIDKQLTAATLQSNETRYTKCFNSDILHKHNTICSNFNTLKHLLLQMEYQRILQK